MANRYWVGGSGIWDTTSTTNWSASSGGSSGASVPTSADSVFFDQASTYTVTMTGGLNCLDITVSSGTVTFATGTGPTLNVAGNWSTIAGTVWNSTGTITFTATTSKTITSGGITINASMTFNGTGGTWTLQDNLTLGVTTLLNLTAGTLSLSSFTFTAGTFNSSNSNVRSINFGTGKIALKSDTTGTVWNTNSTANLTVSGITLVEFSGGGTGVTKTINTASSESISFSFLETTGTVTYSFVPTSNIKDFTVNGQQTFSNFPTNIFGGFTHSTTNGTTTFPTSTLQFAAISGSNTITPAAGVTYDFPMLFGTATSTAVWTLAGNLTLGTTRTLTLSFGTFALGSFTLTTGLFSSANSNTRTINFGTGKVVTTSATTSTVWNTSTSSNLTVSGTPLVECQGGGTAVTKTISTGTLSEANAISFSLLETTGTATYSITAGNPVKNLIINGSQTVNNNAVTIYGSFTHSTGNGTTTFTAGANAWTFAATSGSYAITNISGFTYDFPWTFGSATSTAIWTLAANLTLGATRQLSLTNGTFDFNNKTLSAAGVTIVTGTPTLANTGGSGLSLTVPITHTSGTLTLPFNLTTTSASGYTFTAGTLALSTFTLTTPVFTSNNSNTRTLSFGTGKILLNGTATATVWNTSTVTNLTVSGTPLVECQGGGTAVTKTINTGTLSEANAISFSLLETTGTVTYAFTASNAFKNLIINGSQTVSNIAITIYGNFTHSTSNGTTTFTAGANAWTFGATSGSYTLGYISGFTYDFPWTFGSATSTAVWTLPSNLTLGATRQFSLANGTLDFNSKTLTAAGITIVTGTPTIANTGTGSFTTTLPITHTSGSLTLPFNLTTSSTSGYTFTAGTLALSTYTLTTPVFSSSNSSIRTINFNTGKIVLNGTATATIWNTATTTNMTVSGTPLVECIGGGSAVTKTISAGALSEANAISFSLLETTGTVTYAFTASNTVKNLITNGLQTLSNIAILIYGNFTHSTSNGTTTFTAGVNAWTFAATSGNYTLGYISGFTYDFPWTFGSATSTAVWTLPSNLTLGATRRLTLTNGTLDFNSTTLSAAGITIATGTPTIANTGSSGYTTALSFIHTSGTFTLTLPVTTSSTYTFNAGTLALSTYTLSTLTFSGSGTSARTLNFGTGQLILTGNNATIFDVTTATNFATSGTVYINSTYTGSTGTRTFVTGFSEAQSVGYNVATSGSSGIIIGTTATDTVALTGSFNNFDLSGLTNTLSNTARTIYGNLTLPASSGTLAAGTSATTFGGTSGTDTITTNGRNIPFPLTFNGAGGTFQLQDNLTLTAAVTTNIITLTAGTINLNNLTASAYTFSSNNSNTRAISFGSTGQITVTGNAATVIDFNTMTNYTYTGTPQWYASYSGATGTRVINFGSNGGATATNTTSLSFGTSGTGLVINSSSTDTLTFSGSYNTMNFTNMLNTVTATSHSNYGSITIPATGGTFSAGTGYGWTFLATTAITINVLRTIDVGLNFSGVGGTYQFLANLTTGSVNGLHTLNNGTVDLNNFTLSGVSFTSNNSNTRAIAFGTSGQLTLTGNNTTVLSISPATSFTYTGTPRIYSNYSGATGTRTFLVGLVNADNTNTFNVAFGTSGTGLIINPATDTIALSGLYLDIDYSNTTNTIANYPTYSLGNITVPTSAGTFSAGANIWTLGAPTSTTKTFTTNGRTLDFPLQFGYSPYAGNIQLNGALTIGSTRSANLYTANLDLNNYTLSCNTFIANALSSKRIFFGTSGQITVTGSSATVLITNYPTLFFTTGTPRILLTYSGSVGTRTISFGNIAEQYSFNTVFNASIQANSVTIQPSTDSLAISGSIKDANFTGTTNIITNVARTIYGNLTISTLGGSFTAGTNVTTIAGSNTSYTIDTQARAVDFPFTFDGNGNYTITNNFVIGANTTSSTKAFTLTTGNITINNANIYCGQFVGTSANVRSINFSGASPMIQILNSGTTVWDTTNGSNFTWSGNMDVRSTYTGATGTRTFNFGNIAEAYAPNIKTSTGNCVSISVSTDSVALTGSINNLDLTGVTSTITNTARTVYGNLLIPATGGTFTAGTVATTFGATSGSKTVDTTGRTLQFPLTFGSATSTATWTLSNALVANATTVLTLTNGTTDFNQKALTFANITVLTGNASLKNLNTTLNIIGTSGNLTAVAGAITSTTTGTYTLTAGGLITNAAFSIGALTQNGGNIIVNGGDLTTPTLTTNNSTTRSIQLTSGNINVSSTGTVVNMTTTTGLTANGNGNIQVTSSGSTAITVTPGTLAEANNINYNFTAGTYALTISAGTVKGLNFTGYAGTLGANPTMTAYGNLTFSTGMTLTASANVLTLGNTTSTQNITTNGKTLDFPITVSGLGGNVKLLDALTMGSTRTLTLGNGTIDLNTFNLTTNVFTTATGTKAIAFNSGTLTVLASGATAFNNGVPTGFTTSAGTGNGTISMTSATAKTFVGGNSTYAAKLNQGGAGDLTVTGNNQFNDMAASITSTANANILITAGTTQSFQNFTLTGNATYQPSLLSTANASAYTLQYIGASYAAADYINVRDAVFSSNGWNTGTDYVRWYVGANSINTGNNKGALFITSSPSTQKVYVLESGVSWLTPSDFNTANNTIHIYGGGGGGAGARYTSSTNKTSGGGGGGGGYTKVANITLYANTGSGYSIGAGGTGGAANANGGTGGTTTFKTYSAGGGGGGTTTTVPSSTGGTGGTGSTFNGGQGGPGNATTQSTYALGGGGGGGSGGPNGIGAAGGNGFNTGVTQDASGGGGGGAGGGTAGGNAVSGTSGAGGNNYLGSGGAASIVTPNAGAGNPGARGGGGSGARSGAIGGSGSYGIDIGNGIGGGGGAGGGSGYLSSGTGTGGSGIGYGSGGGGGGSNSAGSSAWAGGYGGQGSIIIVYQPGTAPTPPTSTSSGFFMIFN